MSSHHAGPSRAAVATTSTRAAASRANGAKSRGPQTAEGKARSAQNALKHGLSARKHVLLPDDSRAEFKALEGALLEELRPEGALQTLLVHRLVAAAWRLARADRLEFGLLTGDGALESPGRVLVGDSRAAGVFATLVRYRGGAQAEFFRTLNVLRALQAEAAQAAAGAAAGAAPDDAPNDAELRPTPPESDANDARNEPDAPAVGQQCATKATRNEPERPARASAGLLGQFSPAGSLWGHGGSRGASEPERVPTNR
jgi:hypothetical protein